MAQLFDARGNEFQGQLDQIGGGSFTDARTAGATISATNGELAMDIHGKAVAVFDIRASANVATYVFEGSMDGTNYYTLPARPLPGGSLGVSVINEGTVVSVAVTTTIAAAFAVSATGYRRVRCRSSVTSSGSAVVTARATIADYAIIAQPQPTLQHVTSVGSSGAGNTATLPSVPGMYHYITSIQLQRICSVAVAAGAAPLIATTTNLPGSPAWQVANAIDALGNVAMLVDLQYANPLKSSAAGTNTTFVSPTPQAGNFYRWNISYYLGA
jgi:hypothetical protein